MAGKNERFPSRSFLPFAVGSHAIHVRILLLNPVGKCCACRQREPMPEAAGCEWNCGDPGRRRVPREQGTDLMELLQVVVVQKTQIPQRHIERAGGMTLG